MNSDNTAIDLHYKIRKATTRDAKSPVIILLHGYGSNAEDLFSFAPYLPANHTVISLEAPISLPMGGHAWYDIYFNENQDKWSDDVQALNSINVINLNKLNGLS